MRSVSAQAFKDSILLADIYAIRMLNIGKSAAGKYVVGYTGEEFGFRLALTEGWEDTLSEFIGSKPMDFGDVFLWAVIKGKDLSWWLPKLPTKGRLACCKAGLPLFKRVFPDLPLTAQITEPSLWIAIHASIFLPTLIGSTLQYIIKGVPSCL